MRQLVQDLRSGHVELVEVPDPRPGANELLIRTTWSLISPGTELALSQAAAKSLLRKAFDRPDETRKVLDKALKDGVRPALAAARARLDDLITPGYSSAGIVELVGASTFGARVGDRVGCVGANAACHAERIVVPAPLCIPLPPSLEERFGAFGALGGIAAHGVRLAEVDAGSMIVVIGLGLVGQLVAQLVTVAGGRAICVDVSAERVELAGRLGAACGAVIGRDDVEGLVARLCEGNGADAVIIAAATRDNGPIELAAAVARDLAVVAVIGDVGMDIPRAPFYAKELQLRVSRSYGPGRYDPAYEQGGHDYPIGYVRWTERRLVRYFFEEVAAGRVRLEDLITHEVPIERGVEAYAALSDPGRLAILLRYVPTESAPARRTPLRLPAARRTGRQRVGLIGPGTFARSTLLPLLRSLDVEISGVAGISPARAFGIARQWDAAYATTDPEELLNDPSVDVVVIATRHDSHAGLAARALAADKGVFLEKPLAIDERGLAQLEPLLAEGGRLVVDFNRDFAPALRRLTEHFGGRIEPLFVNYRVNAGYLEPDHWLRDPAQGGGRLVGEGCHFVDVCSLLVGRPLDSVKVMPLRTAPRTLEGDNFTLTLSYDDGSLANVAYIATGSPGLGKERLEVLGDGRSGIIEDFRRVELFVGRRRIRMRRRRVRDKGHAAILRAAFEFFRSGGMPPIPYERLLETTRATFAAREALAMRSEAPMSLSSAPDEPGRQRS